MEKYSLKKLSDNRNIIYFVSIAWIMFFHSSYYMTSEGMPFVRCIRLIKEFGFIGVDIFLFMSGISLYFSYKSKTLKEFYFKRIKRVVPVTLAIQIPYFVYRDFLVQKTGIYMFIKDVTGVSLFTDGTRTMWFITTILFLYLVYPIIYMIYKKHIGE